MRTAHYFVLIMSAVTGLSSGCGILVDCNTPCNRLYTDDQCGIQSPGASLDELMDTCLEECRTAAGTSGEIGDYNPYERMPSNVTVELENRQQVELWRDCIESMPCDGLDDGYCEPVW